MQWIQTTHVRRYHQHYRTCGHVWQGRFKAFPIQEDEHLLHVLRYVERNPLRAGLTAEVDGWAWCSLALRRKRQKPDWYDEGPIPRGRNWRAHVAAPQTDVELAALRRCIERSAPFGAEKWQTRTAKRLGLESTLRPFGRPRKNEA